MSTAHYSEDDLILLFYGEVAEGRQKRDMQAHLDGCHECADAYASLASTLALVSAPAAPERGEHYGLEVWQRLRPVLPSRPPSHSPFWWPASQLAFGGAIAAIVVAAFLVGRSFPTGPAGQSTPAPATQPIVAQNADPADLVRFAAISDHLDQSERLLLDFVNAGGQVVDVSDQQAMASDLVEANRLYREAADGAGDVAIAEVLDSLERSLIEIAHGPSKVSSTEFTRMRMRIDAADLLFRVRVLSDELHERELAVTKPFKKDA